ILEVLVQEAYGEISGDTCGETAGQDLPAHPVVQVTEEIGYFYEAGAENDRCGQEEGEAGRILVVETAIQTADHSYTGAADAGAEGAHLGNPDQQRPAKRQLSADLLCGGTQLGLTARLGMAFLIVISGQQNEAVDD